MKAIYTLYGSLTIDPNSAELGELVVTDEGVELEIIKLNPIQFEVAPEEIEDWGE